VASTANGAAINIDHRHRRGGLCAAALPFGSTCQFVPLDIEMLCGGLLGSSGTNAPPAFSTAGTM
jgi:hypothetical protein